MNRSLLIPLGGFFLLSFIVAYLVPDVAGVWPLLDIYSNFVSMLVPMIRRIEVLSIRLHMAPSYYFSLMWVAAFVLYFWLLRFPHNCFLSPEKAHAKRVFVTMMCLIVIPSANAYFYFLPSITPGRFVTVMTVSRSGLAISGAIHLLGAVLLTRTWWAWFRQRELIYRKHSIN
jgi:hypothetical protein